MCDHVHNSLDHSVLFIYLFIYRFVQCTGERTIGHVVPYLVHPPKALYYNYKALILQGELWY